MGNIFDYIEWRGDLPFSQVPLTEVDNLIFSMVCYVDFDKIVPDTLTSKPVSFLRAAKSYMQRHKGEPTTLGAIMPPEIITLMTKAARSSRFSSTQMTGYVNRISDNEQKQFSAVTYLFDDFCFVAFRGTDDTIIGWKESLNMSFLSPIPAQTEAVAYLEAVADAYPERRIFVGGHSKGGNLAVWASVKCKAEVNGRIVSVYNNDGPGFDTDFIESGSYILTRDRIRTLVPQTSVVGMLLEHEENYEVVKSNTVGLLQHNGLSWEVSGGRFLHLEMITEESKRIDNTLKEWLAGMTNDERKRMLDSIYEILSATNAKTLTDLNSDKLKLVKAWNNLDSNARTFIRRFVSLIVKNSKK